MSYLFGSLWALIGGAVEIYALMHAIRNNRQNWIWILIIVPGGTIAYIIMEILPELDKHLAATRVAQPLGEITEDISRLANPTGKLKELKDKLEFSDTHENRLELARELVKMKLYDEAIELYNSALKGLFKDDALTLKELGQTYFLNEDYGLAIETLEQLRDLHPNYRPTEVGTVYARTLEKSGNETAALDEFAHLAETSTSFEARCRYGLLLQKHGETEQAQRVFRKILTSAERAERNYRRQNREWINIAKQNVVE